LIVTVTASQWGLIDAYEETAILILSVINGIVRYQKMNPDPNINLRSAAVEFCRRSLMNGNMEG
jgi:hypothetical protein